MTQKYQVKVSMKQAAIVETGIVLKQGDFGMQIEIEVLDFDVTGTTPQIVFRKAMGAVESTTITVSGNKYTYTFKGTELDTPGKCFCDLKLKNSTTQRISTASFMFKVVADTLDGLAEESSSYSDTIAQIVEGFDDDIAELREDITKDQDALEKLENIMTVPKLRNGSAGNPENVNAISCNAIFPVGNIKKIFVSVDANKIPLQEGYKYMFSYTAYSVSEGNPASPSLNPYIITSRDPYGYSLTPYITIELPANTKGCVVWLHMRKTDDSGYYSLRVANTGTDAISIIPLYDTVEVNELKAKLYTQLTREPFAYCGSAGNFIFYTTSIFDGAGRCPFKISSDLNIKLPDKSLVSFTNAQILAALTSDDKYTDSSSNEWIYLRAGRALVYNYGAGAIESVLINGVTPLGDTTYPLLMFWSGQAVGGLLYGKFLYDAEYIKVNTLINTTVSGLNIPEREPFMYVGDAGRFVFKNINIFDGNGKCAWRLSSTLNIKIPSKSMKAFSMDQILAVLDDTQKVTESGTTWVYLNAGKGLIYDASTETLSLQSINYKSLLLNKNQFPIIYAWSGQMVGGLLYSKFLFDALKVLSIFDERIITLSPNKRRIDNARHVTHRYNVPAPSVLSILHFSDIHGDSAAMNRIINDSSSFGTRIDEIICTGDIVGNAAEQITSWWNSKVLTCIGNHDSASYSQETGYDWTALSMADRDAYYIAPFESNWGITHTSGTSYYYKDYTGPSIRLIVMDSMLYTNAGAEATAQTAWLEGLLADAITNDLHVIIAVHGPHGGATPKTCSFTKYGEVTMPTQADCNTPQSVVDAVASAISSGLHFIGYLVGHTHQDNIWDAEGDGTQLMYCVTCAIVSQTAQWANSDQARSTTLDAYNIVTIDTTNTLVKIVRGGGADQDNKMRPRKMICFNYSTGEIIGEEK